MKRLIIVLILSGIFVGAVFLPKNFGLSTEKIIFQIERGQSSRDISINLEKDDLIWWSPLFRAYLFFLGSTGKLQAGCYFLSTSMNIPQIAEKFANGDVAKTKVTIPEGFTSAQISERLKNVTRTPLVTLDEHEGYLFPDTYEIPYCLEQEKIVEMMLDNFNRKTANLKITPEIVTMASLLEKELKTKEDKELASGILWKRLKAGMPLQVDAYMWTYENYDLPEKPISNPGLESISAALYQKESPYWYYLSTRDGETIFSRTLEEHNIARARYLTP